MKELRAAVCHTFGEPLRIETVHLRAPGRGEVEVTLAACAICHSDISYIDGGWGGDLPAVYGHEAAGRITSVGPPRVSVICSKACGTCAATKTVSPAATARASPFARSVARPASTW